MKWAGDWCLCFINAGKIWRKEVSQKVLFLINSSARNNPYTKKKAF